MIAEDEVFWVFGYGSLMWRPGFDFLECYPAELNGYHRSLCVYSHVHRGTEEKPGLVFGLDQGGSCKGFAFAVAPENWQQTVDYLRAREQVTSVYIEHQQEITLVGNPARKVTALTYLVDRQHRQYAGRLSLEEQLEFIHQGQGQSGNCRDYVLSAHQHLLELSVNDREIQALANALTLP
ncbi:MAG TPA: gamma-glutamylcyclotransferase [Rhizobiales bacterium]|nr:gamma-glutamylcyclotransferase [Hyphomicrobiales bacterium]